MTYLCSNTKTGLTSEIKSLIDDDIVEVDENGIARLLPNWEERVPPFILYDMLQEGWGKEIDRDNKFCLHDDIRNKLYKAWQSMPDGWVTRNDNSDVIVYAHSEYLDCKESFQNKFVDHENELEGIAQFGI